MKKLLFLLSCCHCWQDVLPCPIPVRTGRKIPVDLHFVGHHEHKAVQINADSSLMRIMTRHRE